MFIPCSSPSPPSPSPRQVDILKGHGIQTIDTKLLPVEHLKVLVDDGDGQEDTRAGTNGAHHVSNDREGSDEDTTGGGSRGDDALQLTVQTAFPMAGQDSLLLLELLGHITGRGARDLDPGLGEESADPQHEDNVDDKVNRVLEGIDDMMRGLHVVGGTTGSEELRGSLMGFPDTKESNKQVIGEAIVEHLGDHEDIGGQGGLEHDGHVGGVEELNGVDGLMTPELVGLDGELDTEALEIDDEGEDGDGGDEIGDVGEVGAVKGLLEGTSLVGPGEEEVEEGNDGTLELGAPTNIDGGGGEGLPDNGLTNVGGDEEGDTRSKAITLLEHLIQKDNDHTGHEQLKDQKEADSGSQVGGGTVKTGEDSDHGLTQVEDNGKELLGPAKEDPIFLEVVIHLDDVGPGQKLHDHARCNDGRDTQFHEGTTVRGKDHTHPVEGIRRVRRHDPVQGNLGADKENEEGDGGP